MEYNISPIQPKYYASFITLLTEAFQMQAEDKEQLIQWKYFHPFLAQKALCYVALEQGTDSVVGQYTNIPLPIIRQHVLFHSLVCVDMAVAKNHRGKGLIHRLSAPVYEEAVRQNYDFSIGFSNDQGVLVDQSSKRYGYTVVGKFMKYISVSLFSKKSKIKLEKIDTVKDTYVFGKNSPFFRIQKSAAYIHWRYQDNPNHEYELFQIIEGDTVRGFVVLKCLGSRCYVSDIITDGDAVWYKKIVTAIEYTAHTRGVLFVIFQVFDTSFWRTVFKQSLYIPVRRSKNNFYLTVKIHNPHIDTQTLLAQDHWFLMNGDII